MRADAVADAHQQRPAEHHQPEQGGDGEGHPGARRLSGMARTSGRPGVLTGDHLVDAQPRGAEHLHHLRGEGGRLGDDAAGGPGGDDLALGEHDDLVGDGGDELDVVGGDEHGVPVGGEVAQDPGQLAPWRCSRGRGSARRAARRAGRGGEHEGQGEREALALGEVARVGGVVDAGHQPVEDRAGAGTAGGALLGDGLEVEQVGGGLRQQRDAAAATGGVEGGGVVRRRGRPRPYAACASPAGPRAAWTCRRRCDPSVR